MMTPWRRRLGRWLLRISIFLVAILLAYNHFMQLTRKSNPEHELQQRTNEEIRLPRPKHSWVTTASPVMRYLNRNYFCAQDPIKRVNGLQEPQIWQTTNHGSQVYSAYHLVKRSRDTVTPHSHVVEILTIGPQETDLHCLLWYKSVPWAVSVPAKTQRVSLDNSTVPHLRRCTLPKPVATVVPQAVSVTRGRCDKPVNIVKVLPVETASKKSEFTFGACLKPLRNRFDDMHAIIELMEILKLQGVRQLTVYDSSVSARVMRVLQHYRAGKSLDLVQWKSKLHDTELDDSAAKIDCLRRNTGRARFVMVLGVNEYVVATAHVRLEDMMRRIYEPTTDEYRYQTGELLVEPSADARLVTETRSWMKAVQRRSFLSLYDVHSYTEVDEPRAMLVGTDFGRGYRYIADSDRSRRGDRVRIIHNFAKPLAGRFWELYKHLK